MGITATAKTSSTTIRISPRVYKNFEVARIPSQVAHNVRLRLARIGRLLASALEYDEAHEILSLMAGVAHDVSVGSRMEVVKQVRTRALKIQLSANDHEDLVAAAELNDLAEELSEELSDEVGQGEADKDVSMDA
jgi:hypothetical protein